MFNLVQVHINRHEKQHELTWLMISHSEEYEHNKKHGGGGGDLKK